MLLRITSQVGVNRLVPKLFNTVPILNHTGFEKIADFVSSRLQLSFITPEEIQLRVVEHVFLADSSCLDSDKVRVSK